MKSHNLRGGGGSRTAALSDSGQDYFALKLEVLIALSATFFQTNIPQRAIVVRVK